MGNAQPKQWDINPRKNMQGQSHQLHCENYQGAGTHDRLVKSQSGLDSRPKS